MSEPINDNPENKIPLYAPPTRQKISSEVLKELDADLNFLTPSDVTRENWKDFCATRFINLISIPVEGYKWYNSK